MSAGQSDGDPLFPFEPRPAPQSTLAVDTFLLHPIISSSQQDISGSPLNLSVKSEYALHAIFDLATRNSADPVRIADIAKRQNIPQKFLELILANLKQGGFVESRRGAEGGYRLARPAGRITIGEVLKYVEGHQREVARSKRGDGSPFAALWKRVDDSAAQVLDSMTFETLAREWAESQRRFVPNWEI